MKALPFAVALILPITAVATVATEQDTQAPSQTAPAAGAEHRPLFTVTYVLRPNPAPMPYVFIERGHSLVPPAHGEPGAIPLMGTSFGDPNTIVCRGRGCEATDRYRAQ